KATALAAIACNDKGDVLNVWAKLHTTCSPLLAEASAILWAVQLARTENWNYIIFEGDAKACFDPLSSAESAPDWSIRNIVCNILDLSESFSSVSFCWVSRNCNRAAHKAASLCLLSFKPFCFHNHSLPIALADVCKADCCPC
ncbi:hypothetical protein SO802_016943, partial [Lithocarpus litseifolius]